MIMILIVIFICVCVCVCISNIIRNCNNIIIREKKRWGLADKEGKGILVNTKSI
jgi:hypothetical protein